MGAQQAQAWALGRADGRGAHGQAGAGGAGARGAQGVWQAGAQAGAGRRQQARGAGGLGVRCAACAHRLGQLGARAPGLVFNLVFRLGFFINLKKMEENKFL